MRLGDGNLLLDWLGDVRPVCAFALAAWVPISVVLIRRFGPARGALGVILGGLLLLPRVTLPIGPLPFDKRVVIGLGLALGALVADPRAWLRLRPRWFDAPMIAFGLAPLLGLGFGDPGSSRDVIDQVAQRCVGWLVPYAVGRAFFGDADGPRRIAVAIVWAGLATMPLCWFEEVAGPRFYLAKLVYGTTPDEGMIYRLGGYRPEAFLDNGLQLASWMALAAVVAAWLWLAGGFRSRWVPIWVACPALVLTSISVRGVYGYLTLALGIALALLTRATRSRAWLVALALVPAGYMVARGSGLWDGQVLERAGARLGRAGTVGFRLLAEDALIVRVLGDGPAFGFGGYVWHARELIRWPDGLWLQLLWSGGLVGLGVAVLGLYAFPAARALIVPRGRPGPLESVSPRWALGCWCVLSLVELLHNNNTLILSGLIAGSIVGDGRGRAPVVASAGRTAWKLRPSLVALVVVLLAIEILGRYAQAIRPSPPFVVPPAPIKAPP